MKTPSQLYKEAHAGNYAMIRTKGDNIVNHALDSRVEREEAWTRKHSTTVHMDKLWKNYQDKTKKIVLQISRCLQLYKNMIEIPKKEKEYSM